MADATVNTAAKITEALAGVVDVVAVYASKKEIIIKGTPHLNETETRLAVEKALGSHGRVIEILIYGASAVIKIAYSREENSRRLPWTNIALFALTVVSTLAAGAFWAGGMWDQNPWLIFSYPVQAIYAGIPFSVSILAILLFHEFGHYIAARIHGVNVSLPYFIPAPPIISPFGTLGALIISKSPFINRKQLFDVGAAGPLAGLVVAIIVLFIGIGQSSIEQIPPDSGVVYMGESLLFKFISYLLKGPIPKDSGLFISSMAFAGWVGLLVTMLNLLPLGQLDGGRIIYALFGRWQKLISKFVILGLVIMSFYWAGWLMWLIIGFFIRPTHPPTIMDEVPIGRNRELIGIISILAFIICFIPIPISFK